ncbi:uncharacterized protein LOC107981216 isoform X1 [Nasonia vitripennis]|uniref:Uncharacterized protein n=1 Tax=Nasonia vitripennis TaxID=7425 RepID=A0A7M7Q4I3_NASVI|nr:uncharacterized protein LOC107981216 isoform X1 [Nasonia vitripennis]
MCSGIEFHGSRYTLNIYAFVLDAPAKAFVLAVKYHSGYNSCTKCTIEGIMYRCVCFPGKIGVLRTDVEFRNSAYQDDYQRSKSIINTIPNLGLVTYVLLDAMHLVYLGCTKKLLLMWLCSKIRYKLPQLKQDSISDNLLALREYIPYDFARKSRHLKYIKFFKATEYRQFLLYTEPIDFLTLHAAINILSTPILCADEAYIDYAEQLLSKFVEDLSSLYGPEYITYNFHNLQHLANDVRRYGQLENFSAFRFENFICRIKRLICTGNAPLQQLMRRCAEIEGMHNIVDNMSKDVLLKMQRTEGPSALDCASNVSQYKIVVFNEMKLNCKDGKNMCILVDNKIVVNALNFVKKK